MIVDPLVITFGGIERHWMEVAIRKSIKDMEKVLECKKASLCRKGGNDLRLEEGIATYETGIMSLENVLDKLDGSPSR